MRTFEENPICDKCGFIDFQITYKPHDTTYYSGYAQYVDEHMIFTCKRCGWKFDTYTKNYKGEIKNED